MDATCRTCGAVGPPWKHLPSVLDPQGVGDPGHRLSQPVIEQPEANTDSLKEAQE